MSEMAIFRQPSAAEYIPNGPVMPEGEKEKSSEADRYHQDHPPDFPARFHFLRLDDECIGNFSQMIISRRAIRETRDIPLVARCQQ
jgi:hypothetical protein